MATVINIDKVPKTNNFGLFAQTAEWGTANLTNNISTELFILNKIY